MALEINFTYILSCILLLQSSHNLIIPHISTQHIYLKTEITNIHILARWHGSCMFCQHCSITTRFLATAASFNVWTWNEDPTTVLPYSVQVRGCYVTHMHGQGSLITTGLKSVNIYPDFLSWLFNPKIISIPLPWVWAGIAQWVKWMAPSWTAERSEFESREARIFSSPCHPDRFWGPPSLLSNGYWGLFPQG
jgi:hypothetical protein